MLAQSSRLTLEAFTSQLPIQVYIIYMREEKSQSIL